MSIWVGLGLGQWQGQYKDFFGAGGWLLRELLRCNKIR